MNDTNNPDPQDDRQDNTHPVGRDVWGAGLLTALAICYWIVVVCIDVSSDNGIPMRAMRLLSAGGIILMSAAVVVSCEVVKARWIDRRHARRAERLRAQFRADLSDGLDEIRDMLTDLRVDVQNRIRAEVRAAVSEYDAAKPLNGVHRLPGQRPVR